MPRPAVLQGPEAGDRIKSGFDTLAHLLALTLGPTQGVILSEPETGSRPELLSDASTIARRVLQLPDRTEDAGAMLLRNLVWRMHLRVGDGSATAACAGPGSSGPGTQVPGGGGQCHDPA